MPEEQKVSLLEKSLSLSKNGGIYYGGARVKPDERTAVLFVGLGGSGADALIRIKDQVKNRMILPVDKTGAPVSDTPKNIGFLEIDTDETVKNLAYGSARFDSFGNEFCGISANSIPDLIADIRKAKKSGVECWQWFDDDVNQVAGAKGAGGIRQIGRMLLSNNIGKVIEAVEGKIKELTQDDANVSELLVYVFSGISGGTGAGTFLDMAYILKKIAKAKNPNVNTMGYLIMTDVNELNGGKVEALRTNGFSCLKELDYWMATGEHGERYYQKFPNGFELNELECPFDFCHILDASDVEGHQFNYDKILRSVAENVFAYISGEVEGAENATGTMAQLYNNIQGYIVSLASTAKYPACYNYLSLGAAKIEIPYTEISTLIAARVFNRLDAGMFKNRPTEEKFNIEVRRNLELAEENIRSALYHNVSPTRPLLTPKNYKYTDVWPGNQPYQDAYNWLAMFQRAVVPEAGNLPAKLEGKLKEYIKSNLKDKKTGPVYLRYFVKSDETYCLYHMLEAFRKYCRELSAQCAANSKGFQDNVQQCFVAGINRSSSKSNVLKAYLDAVEAWYTNEEHAFLNEKIAEVIEKIQGRIQLYYNNVLRPLSDILLELPGIFRNNLEYIRVNETKAMMQDTNILIRPLEFERTRKNVFDAAVVQAENQFLESLSGNIRKWIGRDIDEVDENISTSTDVAGFISSFVSDNFQALLTINMEAVMNTKLKAGESLSDYVKARVEDLLSSSYPMYKESTGLVGSVEQFAIISVPRDCPTIYKVTQEHIKAKHLDRFIKVKKSEEKNRMYIIKIASGYPLYSNAFIQNMEIAYEGQMGNQSTSSGKHLKPEWRDRLPSPYIQLAWKEPYVCERTKQRDKKYKEFFDQCYKNGIITMGEDSLVLRRATPEVADSVSKSSLTAPTILEKLEQFEKIKAKLWNEKNTIKLYSCSSYMKGKDGENGEVANVKENILRFPHVLEILQEECDLADRIERIEEELHFPRFYALACINHMIYTNEVTGDTSYRRTEQDPLPVKLTKGQEMRPDFRDHQIFTSFCSVLDKEMKEEIELQYDNLKNRIVEDSDFREVYIGEIEDYIETYKKEADAARNKMYQASKEDRASWLEKIEFYQGSVEELRRMLPVGRGSGKEKQEGASVQPAPEAVATQAATPPRYLNPQTWQPVQDPQPGQQVFDTRAGQVIVYQPERPRYLNPQTWQPVQDPQPGQQVFDTQAGQVIVYQPERPRYLDPQTWQPVQNPQPGQQVFDTQTGQMAYYNPYAAGGYPGAGPMGQQSMGYPGGPQPGQQPMGYPGAGPMGQQPMGYPGAGPMGQQPMGYPGAGPMGQQPMGYPGGPQPGQQPMGYPGGPQPGQQPMGGYPGGPQPGPQSGQQPIGYQPGGPQPGSQPGRQQPIGYQPGGPQPGQQSGQQPIGYQPGGPQPGQQSGQQPIGYQPGGPQPGQQQPIGYQPGPQPGQQQPIGYQPGGPQPGQPTGYQPGGFQGFPTGENQF